MTAIYSSAVRHSQGVAIVLLIAASATLTLGFACTVPLAAFATMSAVLFKRDLAILTTLGVWLANQAIGFGCMNYPFEPMTFFWGGVLGAVAIASLGAASAVLSRLGNPSGVFFALIAVFAVYQGSIYATCLALGQDVSYYTFAGVSRIFLINAVSLASFLAVRAAISNTVFGRNLSAACSSEGLMGAR
jgi:hypothetical protein